MQSTATLTPADVRLDLVGMEAFEDVQRINAAVFGEARVINSLDRPDLRMYLARVDGRIAGFKVGYGESPSVYYSAKGGVLPPFRRRGLARLMLDRMMDDVARLGYERFAFDTFPNRHPGMTVLALAERFEVTAAGYNAAYKDYRLRFEKPLRGGPAPVRAPVPEAASGEED